MNLQPSAGSVLAAAHHLLDPQFKRSVILLAEHEEQGTLGYVLNRPLEAKLSEILPSVYGFDAPLYWGGPCQNDTLHCLHRIDSDVPGALEIAESVFWGGSFDHIANLLSTGAATHDDVRFFVGYAGWGERQLQSELESDSWIVTATASSAIFDAPSKNLWSRVVAGLGGHYRIIAGTAEHPSLN